MKKIMAVLAAGVIFIALATTSCSDPIEEGPTITLNFGGNSTSRAADDDHAAYPYTPIGGDGSFHKRITYEIEFYQENATPAKFGGTAQPVKTETAKGGGKATIKLASHGKYKVYVSALLDDSYPYAELNGARDSADIGWGGGRDSAGNSYHFLTIDTTKTSSLTVVMKVVNPVFWDASNFEAITAYMYTGDNDVSNEENTIRMAVELNGENWAGILNAISIGSLPQYNLVGLDLSHCTTPNGVFDPDPGNDELATGKAKINKITIPLDAGSIASGTNNNPTFEDFTSLTEVNAPSVTNVGDFAFHRCTTLVTISFPKAMTIGEWAFYNCAVDTVYLPEATNIGESAFQYCSSLTNVSLPKATSIGHTAFGYTSLTNVSLPEAKSIGIMAFGYTPLTNVSLPEVTDIDIYAFAGCLYLTTLRIPKVKTIGDNALSTTSAYPLDLYLGLIPPDLGIAILTGSSGRQVNIFVPTGTNIGPGGYNFPVEANDIPTTVIGDSEWLDSLFSGDTHAYTLNYYEP